MSDSAARLLGAHCVLKLELLDGIRPISREVEYMYVEFDPAQTDNAVLIIHPPTALHFETHIPATIGGHVLPYRFPVHRAHFTRMWTMHHRRAEINLGLYGEGSKYEIVTLVADNTQLDEHQALVDRLYFALLRFFERSMPADAISGNPMEYLYLTGDRDYIDPNQMLQEEQARERAALTHAPRAVAHSLVRAAVPTGRSEPLEPLPPPEVNRRMAIATLLALQSVEPLADFIGGLPRKGNELHRLVKTYLKAKTRRAAPTKKLVDALLQGTPADQALCGALQTVEKLCKKLDASAAGSLRSDVLFASRLIDKPAAVEGNELTSDELRKRRIIGLPLQLRPGEGGDEERNLVDAIQGAMLRLVGATSTREPVGKFARIPAKVLLLEVRHEDEGEGEALWSRAALEEPGWLVLDALVDLRPVFAQHTSHHNVDLDEAKALLKGAQREVEAGGRRRLAAYRKAAVVRAARGRVGVELTGEGEGEGEGRVRRIAVCAEGELRAEEGDGERTLPSRLEMRCAALLVYVRDDTFREDEDKVELGDGEKVAKTGAEPVRVRAPIVRRGPLAHKTTQLTRTRK